MKKTLKEIIGKPLTGVWGNEDTDGTGIFVLRTTNFTLDGIVNYEDVVRRNIPNKGIDEKYLQKGDIIIEKSGGSEKQPVGRVVYFDGEEKTFLFNNFTSVLRIVEKKDWYSKYVFYALYYNYLQGGTRFYQNKTTGLHNLKLTDYIQNFQIEKKKFGIQEKIVEVLDNLRKIIALQKEQLKKLDELVKSMFIEMFGNPILNNLNWEVKLLNEISNGIGDGLHGTPIYEGNGECFFINGNNLNEGKITITEKTKKVGNSEYEKNKIELDKNTILLSINGSLGKIAFYNKEKIMLGKSTCYCKLKEKINKFFIYGLMQSTFFQNYLEECATKSTIKNVSLKSIREFKVICPPLDLQNQFAERVRRIDKSKFEIKQSLEKLEILYKSLMQEYFG